MGNSNSGLSPLHEAARTGDVEKLKSLLEKKEYDINAKGEVQTEEGQDVS